MSANSLPKVSELPDATAHVVMLSTIGPLLRAQYARMGQQPMPEYLEELVQQLSQAS